MIKEIEMDDMNMSGDFYDQFDTEGTEWRINIIKSNPEQNLKKQDKIDIKLKVNKTV